jgi:hypothetical protein
MTNTIDTRRPPGRTAEQQLKALRTELRTREAERKAWKTGAAFSNCWGIPWCAVPGGAHCQGPGCDGCAVADYCRDRAAQIDTTALKQAIESRITPEEKQLMAQLKEIGDRIRGDLDAAQAAGRLPAVGLGVRMAQSKRTGPTVTITVFGHTELIPDNTRLEEWLDYEGELLLAKVDEIADRDGRALQLGGITKFSILKGASK